MEDGDDLEWVATTLVDGKVGDDPAEQNVLECQVATAMHGIWHVCDPRERLEEFGDDMVGWE